MKILIVGIDSTIGRSVANALSAKGHTVIGTSRRESEQHLQFDLNQNASQWPDFPDDLDAAFIAAAITSQSICAENPILARFVNVDQTLRLAEFLTSKGIHVIYPSTNIVLACDMPLQPVDAPLAPIGVYARMKADVETALHGNARATIARLPKILDGNSGILSTWRTKLAQGETIEAFTNLIVSPVSLGYAATFITTLLEKKPNGVWQISGDREISYYDLAVALAKYMGVPTSKNPVIPTRMPESAIAAPLHPGMDTSLTKDVLGMPSQTLHALLEDAHINA